MKTPLTITMHYYYCMVKNASKFYPIQLQQRRRGEREREYVYINV